MTFLIINFIGGPYCGENLKMDNVSHKIFRDGDYISIAGTVGEKYIYQLAGDTAYFVEIKCP